MPDAAPPFFPALSAGARLLVMHALTSISAGEGKRLLDSVVFEIRVEVGATAEATLIIAGDDAPIFRFGPSVWPEGFGDAVAAFVQASLDRLTGHERRLAEHVIPRGARTVVVLQPADQGECRVELRFGDSVATIGRIGTDDGGLTH